MCDTYYTLDTLKVKLGITEADLRIGNTKYAKEAVYQKHLGLYFLHEMMHLDSVGIPHSKELPDSPTPSLLTLYPSQGTG